jgi:hypothetical protein
VQVMVALLAGLSWVFSVAPGEYRDIGHFYREIYSGGGTHVTRYATSLSAAVVYTSRELKSPSHAVIPVLEKFLTTCKKV